MTCDTQSEITERLHCVAGDLNAVRQMIESGQPWSQILHRLAAVRTTLRATGAKIIERQAQSSKNVILNSTSVTERTVALHELQSLYAIFVKQFSMKNEVNDE